MISRAYLFDSLEPLVLWNCLGGTVRNVQAELVLGAVEGERNFEELAVDYLEVLLGCGGEGDSGLDDLAVLVCERQREAPGGFGRVRRLGCCVEEKRRVWRGAFTKMAVGNLNVELEDEVRLGVLVDVDDLLHEILDEVGVVFLDVLLDQMDRDVFCVEVDYQVPQRAAWVGSRPQKHGHACWEQLVEIALQVDYTAVEAAQHRHDIAAQLGDGESVCKQP